MNAVRAVASALIAVVGFHLMVVAVPFLGLAALAWGGVRWVLYGPRVGPVPPRPASRPIPRFVAEPLAPVDLTLVDLGPVEDLLAAAAEARAVALAISGADVPDMGKPVAAVWWLRHVADERTAFGLLRAQLPPGEAAAVWRRLRDLYRSGARVAASPLWREQRAQLVAHVRSSACPQVLV